MNLYTYVENSPIMYIDPTGHWSGSVADAGGWDNFERNIAKDMGVEKEYNESKKKKKRRSSGSSSNNSSNDETPIRIDDFLTSSQSEIDRYLKQNNSGNAGNLWEREKSKKSSSTVKDLGGWDATDRRIYYDVYADEIRASGVTVKELGGFDDYNRKSSFDVILHETLSTPGIKTVDNYGGDIDASDRAFAEGIQKAIEEKNRENELNNQAKKIIDLKGHKQNPIKVEPKTVASDFKPQWIIDKQEKQMNPEGMGESDNVIYVSSIGKYVKTTLEPKANSNDYTFRIFDAESDKVMTEFTVPYKGGNKFDVQMEVLTKGDIETWSEDVDAYLEAIARTTDGVSLALLEIGNVWVGPDAVDAAGYVVGGVKTVIDLNTPARVGDVRVEINMVDSNRKVNETGRLADYNIVNYIRDYGEHYETYDSFDNGWYYPLSPSNIFKNRDTYFTSDYELMKEFNFK